MNIPEPKKKDLPFILLGGLMGMLIPLDYVVTALKYLTYPVGPVALGVATGLYLSRKQVGEQ
jgi:uncharacterized membrane protein